ncbi:MAG TPA: S24/S26 family peptidase [Polyangiaceae bacterium]|nr:S24/S26 family peptidase [Polyangiaceae bacterium]
MKKATTDWPPRMIVELIRAGESVSFRARGSSMWPAIPSGSQIEVEPCTAAELEVGQIAAFERRGRVVVHRVESIGPEGVRFAGDSRERGDGLIAFDHVLGRARVLERRSIRWRLPRRSELRWLWRVLLRRLWSTAGGVRRNSGGASPPT